jgi:cytochrome c peroxidase
VTEDRIARAVACFERTLTGGRSRFDAFLGGKADALSDAEVRGLHLFRTDARCLHCHNGPALTDGGFHDIGLSYYGRLYEDLGRFAVTKAAPDVGRFKTPSLRNVGRTGPYMHNGLFELGGVLSAYNAGMPTLRRGEKHADDPYFPTKSPFLKPLGLNKQDLADLEAFLRALDEPPRRVRPPAVSFPRTGE